MCSYTTAIVSPYLSGSFTKVVRARETFIFTSLARNEGTTDNSGKRFEFYQQKDSNLHRESFVAPFLLTRLTARWIFEDEEEIKLKRIR